MIANMMSIDRRISRPNRKMSIEDRTGTVIGGEQFELCDNFRNQLCKASNMTKTKNDNKDLHASYIGRRATCIQSMHRMFSQRSLCKNKIKAVITIQKNMIESLCRSIFLTLKKAINTMKNKWKMKRLLNKEPIVSNKNRSIMHVIMDVNSKKMHKRRSRIEILTGIMAEIKMSKMIRKKASDAQCYRKIKERTRNALAFILKLCGVNDVSSDDKGVVEEIVKEVMLMLRETQVQASFIFQA